MLADIGVHAYNLACFVSGREAEEVAADLFTAVPGRRLDDNAHVLVRWTGGRARHDRRQPDLARPLQRPDGPGLRRQGRPRVDRRRGPRSCASRRYGEEARTLIRGGHGVDAARACRVSRMPAAHPEGYIEAFANLYRDAAEIIRAHRAGAAVDPARAALVPDVARRRRAASGSSPPPSPRPPPAAPGRERKANVLNRKSAAP